MNGTYETLRADIASIPVIDCHEHTNGPASGPTYSDPLAALVVGYVNSDLQSAGTERGLAAAMDTSKPLEERWKLFEDIWKRTQHTSYARVTKWVLREMYGEKELSLDALKRMAGNLLNLKDEKTYWGILDKAGIRCRIVNIWVGDRKIIEREHVLPDRDRYMIGLPGYHSIHSWNEVYSHTQQIGRTAASLDEYIDICREIFTRLKGRGAIGMKDQSAYNRTLQFDNATREAAEKVFNFFMEDPRRSVGYPESKPLDDYLFHAFMRIARDLDMPVQIHTGHMAGVRNDIAKTNAVHFTSVLELHREVRFDLFHGNWPYMGEWLYLGKNFPNVALDCCWLHIIDSIYAQNVLAESVAAVPHGKIHGFGGDYGDSVEFAAGHLSIARDNIAAALARLVDSGWIGMDDARQIAADWLFNNPNRFFRLGFEPVTV
ncbi:MAG TPA: amidohydrolase family protein [Candidatus Latescibacteria bacterium]|nr:amidohydrolase family protein [Candidatus Latescibacterota bacterium]